MTNKEFEQLKKSATKIKTVKALLKLIEEKYLRDSLMSKAYSGKSATAIQSTKGKNVATIETNDKKLGMRVRTAAESSQADATRQTNKARTTV